MGDFIAIGLCKLEIDSVNTKFGWKSAIFCPVWPWNSTDDLEKQKGTSFMLLQALCINSKPSVNSKLQSGNAQFELKSAIFVPGELESWRMTLKAIEHLFYASSNFMHHFIAICNSNWSNGPETPKLGQNLFWSLWPWLLTLRLCMNITSVSGNNSWKFHDDTMMRTQRKRCDGQTDRRTDGRANGRTGRETDGLNHSKSCLVAAKNSRCDLRYHNLSLWIL